VSRILSYLLVITAFSACTTPAPTTGCKDDSECRDGNQECHQGTCVAKGAVACSADSDCTAAVAAKTLAAPGDCEDLKCTGGYCAVPPKAVGATCNNTGSPNCTNASCDGKGQCQVIVTKGCFIDSKCWQPGDTQPDNTCASCDPNSPSQWTAATDDGSVSCKDGLLPCQSGVCQGGKCAPFNGPDDSACKDDATCISAGLCKSGHCQNTTATCDDSNPCTDDACNGQGKCSHTANTATCDDGVACTLNDLCGNTACVGTPNDATCSDSNVCTEDTCDKAKGCQHANSTASCDDGDACTSGDSCVGGACQAGTEMTCDDKNPCTADTCTKGACSYVKLPDASTCTDDGLACTSDTCASGACTHPIAAGNCLISGVCAATGALSGDGCLVCDPAQDSQDWSVQPVDTVCQKGAICQVGKCTAAHVCNVVGTAPGFCFIDQACVADGVPNPANSCELCNAANQSTWSLAKDATVCASDNVACTDDLCASGTCVHVANPFWCADKTGPCTLGECDMQNGCVAVPSDVTTACNSDANACTLEHCGNKNGVCETTAATLDCDDGIGCTLDACDMASGCTHTAQNAACDDGNICTSDSCDAVKDCQHGTVPGSCSLPGDVSCSADVCNSGVCQAGVIADMCNISGSCVAKGALNAEGCEVCEPGKATFAWSNSADGTACSDGKACHVNQCASGACNHGLAGGWCEIDGACQLASAAKSDDVCLVCTPATSTSVWSPASSGTSCGSDSIACTSDQCDGSGACKHTATDSLCTPTPDTCNVPLCKPADPQADAATGCVPMDDCPVGHHCDATAKACLTDTPIAIVTAGGDHPNPTNPALLRHVLDEKTGTTRTWIAFQTDTCATAANSQWSITKPAGLRAAIVDSIVGLPASKATTALAPVPIVSLPTATGWSDATTVCQGYPTVAHDPLAANLGWLSWLESAPGQTTACLTGNGQGGLLRLGRLDGGAIPGNATWSAVAGDQADLNLAPLCTAKDAFLPSFLTAGFAVLPVAGSDVASKAVVSVRPYAPSLSSAGSQQMLRAGATSANVAKSLAQITGPFSLPHPVLVDAGASAPSTERFWTVALNEDTSGDPVLRSVWAAPISSAGSKGSPVEWTTGTTPVSGSGTGDLHDITAVCAMDASVDAGGNVGVALVVRRAGKDAVLLVTRAAGSATGVVTTVKEQASSDPGCSIGISVVRIVGRAAGDFVFEWLDSTGPTDASKGAIWLTSSAANTPVQLATLTAWDTDGAAAPLAWRGLGGLAVGPGGVVTTIIEGRSGTSRTLFLHSLKL
jgi:hypothetical protein